MKRQVRILRKAERDMGEIFNYVARERPTAARSVLEGLLSACASFSDHAERGPRPKDQRLDNLGFRYLVKGPYLVFYKVLKRQVRVYRILHGRRRYREML